MILNLYLEEKKKKKKDEGEYNRTKNQERFFIEYRRKIRIKTNTLYIHRAQTPPPDPILSTRYICHNSRRALKNVTRFRRETRRISLYGTIYIFKYRSCKERNFVFIATVILISKIVKQYFFENIETSDLFYWNEMIFFLRNVQSNLCLSCEVFKLKRISFFFNLNYTKKYLYKKNIQTMFIR